MKKLLYSILAIGFCAAMNSCWQEDIPEAGAARHQVTELKGVPGDEEAQLTWTMPENWEPTAVQRGTKPHCQRLAPCCAQNRVRL